jgi:hypothetical protein
LYSTHKGRSFSVGQNGRWTKREINMRNDVLGLCGALILGFLSPLAIPGPAGGQMGGFRQDAPPDTAGKWVTIPGMRHGVSFFPRAVHPEVEYEAGPTLTFDRYHTVDVMYEWLRRWEERYPNLIDVYEVDRSFGGLPILMATVWHSGALSAGESYTASRNITIPVSSTRGRFIPSTPT